eukprot:COSAG06_NODE_4220_length_4461_cov_82.805594_1_plen_134_part_00
MFFMISSAARSLPLPDCCLQLALSSICHPVVLNDKCGGGRSGAKKVVRKLKDWDGGDYAGSYMRAREQSMTMKQKAERAVGDMACRCAMCLCLLYTQDLFDGFQTHQASSGGGAWRPGHSDRGETRCSSWPRL